MDGLINYRQMEGNIGQFRIDGNVGQFMMDRLMERNFGHTFGWMDSHFSV